MKINLSVLLILVFLYGCATTDQKNHLAKQKASLPNNYSILEVTNIVTENLNLVKKLLAAENESGSLSVSEYDTYQEELYPLFLYSSGVQHALEAENASRNYKNNSNDCIYYDDLLKLNVVDFTILVLELASAMHEIKQLDFSTDFSLMAVTAAKSNYCRH